MQQQAMYLSETESSVYITCALSIDPTNVSCFFFFVQWKGKLKNGKMAFSQDTIALDFWVFESVFTRKPWDRLNLASINLCYKK